jgi:hypothetical protein
MTHNPVIVYVADKAQSEAFARNTDIVVYGADTMRNALAQTIFTYPDAIVIDASEDMLRAEDTFFHLRTIEHPPIVILSNMPQRWETENRGARVVILPENSPYQSIAQTVYDLLAEAITSPC